MPPCGFDNNTIDGLKQLLVGNFQALKALVDGGRFKSVEEGLAHERKIIALALEQEGVDPMTRAALVITDAGYERLQQAMAREIDFDRAVIATLESAGTQLAALHVEDDGTIVERTKE